MKGCLRTALRRARRVQPKCLSPPLPRDLSRWSAAAPHHSNLAFLQFLVVCDRGFDAVLRFQEKLLVGLSIDGFAVIDGGLLQEFLSGRPILTLISQSLVGDSDVLQTVSIVMRICERRHGLEIFEIATP
jgi:hypothetical protein